MYAVILCGGRQYRVEEGKDIIVDKIDGKEGEKINLEKVTLLCNDDKIEVGKPSLDNVLVEATIKKHIKGNKLIAFKYKPKKRYRRKVGHRQKLTVLHLDRIKIK